jgi:hypothetical protein
MTTTASAGGGNEAIIVVAIVVSSLNATSSKRKETRSGFTDVLQTRVLYISYENGRWMIYLQGLLSP